jgi:FKBP-type peptidyl-prolyl cis-trans isomerase
MRNYYPGIREFLLIAVMVLPACDPPVQEYKRTPAEDGVSEQFVRANQYSQRRHQDHISAFVERVGWDARVSPSGLWITVKHPGSGPMIVENDRVTYTYTSRLLDGAFCYSADTVAPKQIVVGQGGVESGVEEGIRMLRPGSDAIFIIPPHLAHGNFGDRDRIPGNSVLIYSIQILEVQ